MKILYDVKTIGEQLLSLSVELLRLLDADEQERLAIIERVKKTVKLYRFHKMKGGLIILKNGRHFI